MRQWFLGALLFYLHCWRFSDCMRDFTTACIEDAALWLHQDESALEAAIQAAMLAICTQACETSEAAAAAEDPRFLIERKLVPRNALMPHSWAHYNFPFRQVGMAMCRVLGCPRSVHETFADIYEALWH